MLDMLIERYNLAGLAPVPVEIKLLFSKAVVTSPCRDAQDCIVALLTDPCFEDKDYLFFNDDPLCPPPEQQVWIADLNTGDAHL